MARGTSRGGEARNRQDSEGRKSGSHAHASALARRVIRRDHLSRHQAAFVFRNGPFVGSRVSHGLGIALLAGPGDDLGQRIQRFRRDRDVEIVGVVVDDHANAQRALDPAVSRMSCRLASPWITS